MTNKNIWPKSSIFSLGVPVRKTGVLWFGKNWKNKIKYWILKMGVREGFPFFLTDIFLKEIGNVGNGFVQVAVMKINRIFYFFTIEPIYFVRTGNRFTCNHGTFA